MSDVPTPILEYRHPGTHNRTRLWFAWVLLLCAFAAALLGVIMWKAMEGIEC